MQKEWQLATSVPAWAWRFYRRHWAVIVGLSLVASIQRLIVVNWTEDIPEPAALASEVVVMGARLAIVVVVWRLATPAGRVSWQHCRTFVAEHWPSLLIQCGLIMLAALVFDTGLEGAGALLPESAQQTYLAVLLFIKNPTIIAFTFVWLVGLARQLVVRPSTSDVRV
jgi:hypothetical protein